MVDSAPMLRIEDERRNLFDLEAMKSPPRLIPVLRSRKRIPFKQVTHITAHISGF